MHSEEKEIEDRRSCRTPLDNLTFELISVVRPLKPKYRVDLGIWVWPKMEQEFGVNR